MEILSKLSLYPISTVLINQNKPFLPWFRMTFHYSTNRPPTIFYLILLTIRQLRTYQSQIICLLPFCSNSMYQDIDKLSYPMKKESRGIGLVIVNHFYDTKFSRDGAQIEEENLSELFTFMGLEVRLVRELTHARMIDLLTKTASDPRLKIDSILAVAISSHGNEDGLMGIDYDMKTSKQKCISSYQICNIFNGKNCPNLRSKPKLILLNGCRGKEREEKIVSDGFGGPPKQLSTTWSDFFVIHSCPLGLVSFRSTAKGSLFISEFLTAYKDFGKTIPLDLMMVIVNRKIISITTKVACDSSQSCTWESSCTRAVHIPPFDSLITPVTAQPAPSDDSFKLVWATCRKGIQGPNQMSTPGGVITTPDDGLIYITDSASKCIWVYSSDGEPVYQDISPKKYIQLSIGNLGLTYCWGMCIHKKFLFVSCTLALIKFSLIGGGLLAHKFHDAPISGMDVDDYESTIYACERHSCKVLLLDLDLTVLPKKLDLTHTLNATTDRLMDIKVLNDELYILVSKNQHAIQTFDKKGNHLRNLVSREHLNESLFFTINRMKKTIFAGDIITHELKAFNANGTLMYKTGCHGDKRGNLIEPAGIDLNTNGEVIIVSPNKTKFMLQCFQVHSNI